MAEATQWYTKITSRRTDAAKSKELRAKGEGQRAKAKGEGRRAKSEEERAKSNGNLFALTFSAPLKNL